MIQVRLVWDFIKEWRLEAGLGISLVLLAICLIFVFRAYRMVSYLVGGRVWKGRFREIKRKFMRGRRG